MHNLTSIVELISAQSKVQKNSPDDKRHENSTIFCTFTPNAIRPVQISAPKMVQMSVLLRDQDEKFGDLLPECHNFV